MNTKEQILAAITRSTPAIAGHDVEKIYEFYIKQKIVLINPHNGQWRLAHGDFLKPIILKRALEQIEFAEKSIKH